VAYRVTSLDRLGPGVFRKLRPALGITAFGANGLVLPPGTEWFNHFHERQDELYFVHAGRAGFDVDGETFEVGPGGAVHVESTTPRHFWNAGDEDSCSSPSAARTATSSATGTWSTPQTSNAGVRSATSGDLDTIRRRAS
jgi:quercetin dioxygenase-like cupin family protein